MKIGDRIESSYLKGYFKVYDIKRGYRDGKDTGNILLLKKAFTGAMKFSFSAEKCHVTRCEKLSESKAGEIEKLLNANPSKRKKSDEMPPLFPCIQNMYFLNVGKTQAENVGETLKALPRYLKAISRQKKALIECGKCPIKQRIREDNVTAHKNSDTRFSA